VKDQYPYFNKIIPLAKPLQFSKDREKLSLIQEEDKNKLKAKRLRILYGKLPVLHNQLKFQTNLS